MKFLKTYWKEIAAFLLIAANLGYMHVCNGWSGANVLSQCDFLNFLFLDTAIVLLIFYILSLGHKKIAYILSFSLSLSWTLLNVYYHRFFDQYFNFRDFGEAKNLKDGVVWGSIFSGIQVSDVFLLVTIALFVVLMVKIKSAEVTVLERIKRLKIYVALPLVMVAIYGFEHAVDDAILAVKEAKQRAANLQGWQYLYIHKKNIQDFGVICGQLYDDVIVKRGDKVLTSEEETLVEQHCSKLCDGVCDFDTEYVDSVSNNIILILLESALSCPIGEVVDGVEITPNLNALIKEPNTYYNGKCKVNTSIGESFDGQFIYHTGLLPLVGKLTSTYAVDNELKAFPQLLKEKYGIKSATMAIPTGAGMWRQKEMSALYGYDVLYSTETAIGNDKEWWRELNDSLMVDLLISKENEMFSNPPFLHTVLTISMHSPYDDKEKFDEDIPANPSYSSQMNNYLKRYHYTDRQLGRYFQYLKSKGMYDNSIIVVVSDHDAHANFLNMSKEQINNAYLPFIIAHADLDPEKCWTEEMNQLDVFTTLLDLLNLETDWCGLGSSVLDKEHYENRLNDTTQKVSDLIIESNYWKSKE